MESETALKYLRYENQLIAILDMSLYVLYCVDNWVGNKWVTALENDANLLDGTVKRRVKWSLRIRDVCVRHNSPFGGVNAIKEVLKYLWPGQHNDQKLDKHLTRGVR